MLQLRLSEAHDCQAPELLRGGGQAAEPPSLSPFTAPWARSPALELALRRTSQDFVGGETDPLVLSVYQA